MNIRIIATPRGQAPEWVREQWIGVIIPLSDQEIKGVQLGVRGGKPENLDGYTVSTSEAIKELEKKSPEAAKWWKENFLKPLCISCSQFVFGREFCEIVE